MMKRRIGFRSIFPKPSWPGLSQPSINAGIGLWKMDGRHGGGHDELFTSKEDVTKRLWMGWAGLAMFRR